MNLTLIILACCAIAAILLIIIYIWFGRKNSPFTLDIGGGTPKASGGSDASAEKTLSSRLIGFAAAVGGVFVVLLGRLWTMQLLSSADYSAQAERNRTRTVTTAAPRGRILDRNGVELVTNRPSPTVVARADVAEDNLKLQILANLLGMPVLAVRRKILDTSDGAQAMRTVSVDVSRRVVAYIYAHNTLLDGVSVEERTQRAYPNGSLAAHVVGYTGTVTQEQLENSKTADGGFVYAHGDIVGQTGVEYQYESALQGVRGEQTVYVDAAGNVLSQSTSIQPQSGSDITLTIDANIQKAAEASLVSVINVVRSQDYQGRSASVVALDCTNGEVLAMASYPTYSPAMFVGGISSSDWDTLSSKEANYPLMNRAIAGMYPSGSTIKALSAFAGLKYGICDSNSSWYCTGYWTGFGEDYGMHCWLLSGHGTVNLITGITNSCDIVFYEIGKGFFYSDYPEGLQETYRSFGLGSASGIDLPDEASGRVPDAKWKWDYFSSSPDDARKWQGGDNCNLAIGQGDLLVTCLQMANAYCGVANRGQIWKPHVLKSINARNGNGSVIEYKTEVILNPEEKDEHRDIVARGLYGVVYEESTTQAMHWTNLDVTVCGKTGTAEQQAVGEPVGWFVGYAPADNPKYVVAANLDCAPSGAGSGMYIVRDVFGAIYNQPDKASR
ncbi:MAG: penicillin-binding protein 2 [Atopobiaceae bacterium]|nr:penicillin-binding protein 2 [Atopobiaceae bacterium]